jgi:hypothetical protein
MENRIDTQTGDPTIACLIYWNGKTFPLTQNQAPRRGVCKIAAVRSREDPTETMIVLHYLAFKAGLEEKWFTITFTDHDTMKRTEVSNWINGVFIEDLEPFWAEASLYFDEDSVPANWFDGWTQTIPDVCQKHLEAMNQDFTLPPLPTSD